MLLDKWPGKGYSPTVKCPRTLAFFLLSSAAAAQQPKPQTSEQVFRNVQVLKGIPVDEFMSTMGIFSAALGMSCEDCHATNDSNWKNYALDTSAKKQVARRMILMMSRINKENFGGRQVVTCFSCHRGANRPRITPNLATLYTTPVDPEDIVDPAPAAPSVDQVFDKYLQALGGAQRLAGLTSYIARGTSAGYGPESNKRPVEIYAKFPGQRTTVTHTSNGDSTTTYDGKAGWIAAPLRPVPVLALAGSSLEGVRIDAALSFPARIREVLSKWRAGFPITIDDRDVNVVQGSGADGAIATFYFDAETGLLVRMVRYANSPVGRIPTQIDYADYREVAGIKMSYRWTVTWLDGKETFELTDVQPNVPIDAAKFARPHY
jgi:photosynthetic reaction center cytochrome c subunit